jgi:hypothetical protein
MARDPFGAVDEAASLPNFLSYTVKRNPGSKRKKGGGVGRERKLFE